MPSSGLKLIYLASPYTHANRFVRAARAREAARIAGVLASRGFHVYSPIAHGHALDYYTKPKIKYQYWIDSGLNMLERCDVMYVAMMKGWYQSVGIHTEISFAFQNDMPILFLDPKGCTTSEEFVERRSSSSCELHADRREPLHEIPKFTTLGRFPPMES